ncbi:MAG: ATP-binding protein, partial [Armatimonadota bacterium]
MPEKFIGHLTLELKNIACFREFKVDLRSGEVTEVTGGNGRGKSTLLTCLKNNVTGKPVSFPDWLVTDFENRGTVKASIDDRVTVSRDLTSGETASALALYDEHGDLLNGGKKQMESLRSLFGDGTYLNPVEVVNMRPGDRTKAIATALPIDPRTAADALAAITGRPVEINTREQIFPAIQQAHDSLYELRRQKHVAYKDADAQADGVLSFLPAEWLDQKGQVPAPKEPEPLGDIYDRKKNAEIRNGERAQLMLDIAELEEIIRNGDNAVAGHELKL